MDQIITSDRPRFHSPTHRQLSKNSFDRYISAEIEVAGMTDHDQGNGDRVSIRSEFTRICEKWGTNVVRDGSLPSTGFEINTAPAGGDLFVDQINSICNFLKEKNSFVDSSCGLHIHFDARDSNYERLVRYAKLWQKVESAMFSLVTPDRKTSTYCAPLNSQLVNGLEGIEKPNSAQIKKLFANVYGNDRYGDGGDYTNVNQFNTQRRPGCRYRSINLHSLFYRGTVENRMHHGTINARKIINWALLNVAVYESAGQMNSRDIASIGENDGLSFLAAISPTQDLREWVIERFKFFSRTSMNGPMFTDVVPASEIEPNERPR